MIFFGRISSSTLNMVLNNYFKNIHFIKDQKVKES